MVIAVLIIAAYIVVAVSSAAILAIRCMEESSRIKLPSSTDDFALWERELR
jgi:hypothetical protein